MITLTYGRLYPRSGAECKTDLNRWLTWLRGYAKRERWADLAYLWVMEFQKRGAPHFHVLLTVTPEERLRRKFAYQWASAALKRYKHDLGEGYNDVWTKVYHVHSHEEQWQKEKVKDGLMHYLGSYLSKSYQKCVPKDFRDTGRWWGHSRSVGKIEAAESYDIDEGAARAYLEAISNPVSGWDVLPKFIWARNVSRETLRETG